MTLEELLHKDINLASPPQMYMRLKETLNDPGSSLRDIEIIIESDPAFAVRLLRLANSAYFGQPKQVVSLRHALSLIGMESLEHLVIGTVVVEKFNGLNEDVADIYDFWADSVRCALIAQALSEVWPTEQKNRATWFLCGLLHDIGRLVFYQAIPEQVNLVKKLSQSQWQMEAHFERAVLGFDHYQLGADLCRLWQLPDILANSIAAHSQIELWTDFRSSFEMINVAFRLSRMDFPEPETLLEYGLDDADIGQALDQAHVRFEQVFKVFFPTKPVTKN